MTELTVQQSTSLPAIPFNPFSSFPKPLVEPPKPEVSQAFLEAVAASQRINASKHFAEPIHNTNSNDSMSNGPVDEDKSNAGSISSNSKSSK